MIPAWFQEMLKVFTYDVAKSEHFQGFPHRSGSGTLLEASQNGSKVGPTSFPKWSEIVKVFTYDGAKWTLSGASLSSRSSRSWLEAPKKVPKMDLPEMVKVSNYDAAKS